MTEKEIRERVEWFLKRTAQAVVVPATMGLGLSQAGCDSHSLHPAATDAAGLADAAAEVQRPDAAVSSDLPQLHPPYLLVPPPDDASLSPDLSDTGPEAGRDAQSEVESEAGAQTDAATDAPARTDVNLDLPYPPPPYLAPSPPDVRPDLPGTRLDLPDVRPDLPDARPDAAPAELLPPPPPPYMVPPDLLPPGQSKK